MPEFDKFVESQKKLAKKVKDDIVVLEKAILEGEDEEEKKKNVAAKDIKQQELDKLTDVWLKAKTASLSTII